MTENLYSRKLSVEYKPVKGREIVVENGGVLFQEYIKREFWRYLPGFGKVVSSRARTVHNGDLVLFRSFSVYLTEDRSYIAVPTPSLLGKITSGTDEFMRYVSSYRKERRKLDADFWNRKMAFSLDPVPYHLFGVMLGKYPVSQEGGIVALHSLQKVKTTSILVLSDGESYQKGDLVEVMPDSVYYLDPIHGLVLLHEDSIVGKVEVADEILVGIKQIAWIDENYGILPPDYVLIGEDSEVDEYRFNLLKY